MMLLDFMEVVARRGGMGKAMLTVLAGALSHLIMVIFKVLIRLRFSTDNVPAIKLYARSGYV